MQARIEQKLFYQKLVRKLQQKSEFAVKKLNLYWTTTMSKIGPPHNYRGNKYITN